MWCKSCRQDVPGLVSPGEKCYCCARCGSVLHAESSRASSATAERPTTADASGAAAGNHEGRVAVRYDPWELNERLRHIQRVLHRAPAQLAPRSGIRWDHPSTTVETDDSAQAARWATIVSWALMALGFGVFACGAALVGLSLVNGRSDLWRLGLPTVLVGQFVLLLALVMQVVGRYSGRKSADGQMNQLDDQLESIRRRLLDNRMLRDRIHSGDQ